MNLVFKEKDEFDEIFMIRCEKEGRVPTSPVDGLGDIFICY